MMRKTETVSPRELLDLIGTTPADNIEGYRFAVPWKSKIVGAEVRKLLHYQKMLEAFSHNPFLGPIAYAAALQSRFIDTFITEPIRSQARIAVRASRNPDAFGEMNGWIYQTYAQLMLNLCTLFMEDGKLNQEKAREFASSDKGKKILKNYMRDFSELERMYSSVGLTRLKAMKELLKNILIVITEKLIDGEPLPFVGNRADDIQAFTFEGYLKESTMRIENLYRERAFDSKEYSERFTHGKIGCMPYEIVPGSQLHAVTLRHYPLPQGVESNGKILYLPSPLINLPDIYDLAKGKSVIEGMLNQGYEVYLVDHGNPGAEDTCLGLDFYGKTVPDLYLGLIKSMHPGKEILIMAYCMAGTLILPYLARRAEELHARRKKMDITKVALMAAPFNFDDSESGHKPMRTVIRRDYDPLVMDELFGDVNIPPQVIEVGMNEIQPGVQYTVASGFYARSHVPGAIEDAAPFMYWLTHGTKFPSLAHRQWIERIFIGNEIVRGEYRLPSSVPQLDGKPVDMRALERACVSVFCYRGTRDPIAPASSCVASERWGKYNLKISRGGLNRTIEKNVGHIFVVSKVLLAEYLDIVSAFFRGEQMASDENSKK